MKKPALKPLFRVVSTGKFFRLWPGPFRTRFPTGPYSSIEEGMAFSDFYKAARACGYKPTPRANTYERTSA